MPWLKKNRPWIGLDLCDRGAPWEMSIHHLTILNMEMILLIGIRLLTQCMSAGGVERKEKILHSIHRRNSHSVLFLCHNFVPVLHCRLPSCRGIAMREMRICHPHNAFFIVQAAALAGTSELSKLRRTSRRGTPPRVWERRAVCKVHESLRPIYFRPAYRMTYKSFLNPHEKLENGIRATMRSASAWKRRGNRGEVMWSPLFRMGLSQPAFDWHVLCTISVEPQHMTSWLNMRLHTKVPNSVWFVIEAINCLAEFHILYPSEVKKQISIAAGFQIQVALVSRFVSAVLMASLSVSTSQLQQKQREQVLVDRSFSVVVSISLASIARH